MTPNPSLATGYTPGQTTELRTTRYLKSGPAALWRCFTEGALLVHWFRPGGADMAGALVEPRRGGRFDLTHARAGARLDTLNACVLEAEPGAVFAVTTAMGADYRPLAVAHPATLIVEFNEIASGTRLEARLMHPETTRENPLMGWEEGLGALDALATGLK